MSSSRRPSKRRQSNTSVTSSAKPDVPLAGLPGGRLACLSTSELDSIHQGVIRILSHTGLSLAPDFVVKTIVNAGGTLKNDERLIFPESLIERAITEMPKGFALCGQEDKHTMTLTDGRVYMGSGGASPLLLDRQTGCYRESTLQDLYDAARLVNALDNIHFFSRSLVARDMPDELSLDINTAYACLKGTSKHVMVSATNGEHAKLIADMCFMIAGSNQAFQDKPFLSFNINHVTPPLRFSADSCEVLQQAALLGIPAHCNIFGQMGASSPVTMAGTIAQTAAESLAGMIFTWLINPEAKCIFGPRAMVTDLRTGGFSGGGGEQALITAAMTQMARYYGFTNSCIAGATDSKLPDAQSGHEKSFSINMAAQSGCNLITQAAGVHAGLMGVALESYVIDNDMLGGILSSLRSLDVNEETLAIEQIDKVVHDAEHFLGEQSTMDRMKSDYYYPSIADRRSTTEWEQDGSLDIRKLASIRTDKLLQDHQPNHLSAETDHAIRTRFDIRL